VLAGVESTKFFKTSSDSSGDMNSLPFGNYLKAKW